MAKNDKKSLDKKNCAVCGQPAKHTWLYATDAVRPGLSVIYTVCSRRCSETFVADMRRMIGINPALPSAFAD